MIPADTQPNNQNALGSYFIIIIHQHQKNISLHLNIWIFLPPNFYGVQPQSLPQQLKAAASSMVIVWNQLFQKH